MTSIFKRTYPLLLPILSSIVGMGLSGIPRPEEFFDKQIVDHFSTCSETQYWTQRYYSYNKHFAGPGHPIFVILGGEGAIPPTSGIFYPFVADHLALQYGGYVLEPEHRFYGRSQPPTDITNTTTINSNKDDKQDPRVTLFTPEQALWDAVVLLDWKRDLLGCSKDRSSPDYCPIITVGGSYPGWLSAMARIIFPHIVDMAYAASAPIGFYAQMVHPYAYYDHITKVAEGTISGCAKAVRSTLTDIELRILVSDAKDLEAETVGICAGTVPSYILDDDEDPNTRMVEELMMVIGYTFANDNMGSYPPSTGTRLYRACQTFLSATLSSTEKVKEFLVERLHDRTDDSPTYCWNMMGQLPAGPRATISSGDWSGVGNGANGESWDFQTCTLLVEAIGFSNEDSMFVPRKWSLDWLTQHCQSRFGVTPQPYKIVNQWHFDDLVRYNVSHILFTNGLKDGWSVGGVRANLSDALIAINFPNGAHHSDLSHLGPHENDTDDILEGYKTISNILGTWLDELEAKRFVEKNELLQSLH